jgi:glycosyltransferase involved in cell wall biosynthesis
MPRGISPLGLLKSYRELQRVVRKEQPQIIHAHFSIPALLLALISTKAVRMATFQGLFHTQNKGVKSFVVGILERFSIRRMDKAYVVSAFDKERVNSNKLHVQPGYGFGCEAQRFNISRFKDRSAMRKALGLPEDKIILLFTGRYVPFKGFNILPDILNELNSDIYLLLTCGVEDVLHPLSTAFTAAHNWRDLGWRQDIAELMYCADIFLFPSLREGMPVSLMEAMCMALPPIVAPVRGSSEVVKHQTTGWIVENHTPQEYAEAIKTLMDNHELYRSIQSNLRAFAPQLDRQNFVEWQVGVYAEVFSWGN